MARRRPVFYWFIRGLVHRLFFGLRTGGLRSITEKNVPRKGPVILAANHQSHLDPPAIGCGTVRPLSFMAKEELFKGFFGKIIAWLGAFPVKRGEGDTESIRHSIELLQSGDALLVFPEGTRGDGKVLGPLNQGVALLAKRTGALVVPVAVVGTNRVLPSGSKKIARGRITIVYGEPFTYESLAAHGTEKANREAFTRELGRRIVELCRTNGGDLREAAE